MKRHAFYPTVIPTVRSRRSAFMRYLRWLVAFSLFALMVIGAMTLIAVLHGREAQLDSAFMQGMVAGSQFCGRGI